MKICRRRNRNQHRQMVWYVIDFRDFRYSLVLEWSCWFRGFWEEIILSDFAGDPRQRSRYSDFVSR